jgi:hypothetical protein
MKKLLLVIVVVNAGLSGVSSEGGCIPLNTLRKQFVETWEFVDLRGSGEGNRPEMLIGMYEVFGPKLLAKGLSELGDENPITIVHNMVTKGVFNIRLFETIACEINIASLMLKGTQIEDYCRELLKIEFLLFLIRVGHQEQCVSRYNGLYKFFSDLLKGQWSDGGRFREVSNRTFECFCAFFELSPEEFYLAAKREKSRQVDAILGGMPGDAALIQSFIMTSEERPCDLKEIMNQHGKFVARVKRAIPSMLVSDTRVVIDLLAESSLQLANSLKQNLQWQDAEVFTKLVGWQGELMSELKKLEVNDASVSAIGEMAERILMGHKAIVVALETQSDVSAGWVRELLKKLVRLHEVSKSYVTWLIVTPGIGRRGRTFRPPDNWRDLFNLIGDMEESHLKPLIKKASGHYIPQDLILSGIENITVGCFGYCGCCE